MSNVAPYEVLVTGTDDETFAWSTTWTMEDGTPFAFADYAIEYVVVDDCGGQRFLLTKDDGITVNAGTGAIEFKNAAVRLDPGRYEHGCRIRSLLTGDEIQVFEGVVSISEGHF